jgi:predicted DNA binding CopG/RHH family protein
MKKYRLEKEEQEILDAIENGHWELVKPKKAQLHHYAEIARNTFRKDQRMNIRISKTDLSEIKVKALEEGVPYQTLVASIIHKYISGNLIPNQELLKAA